MEITTHSDTETRAFGKKVAKEIKRGIIALFGDLGAGKTTFVQGFVEGKGISDRVISPTFILMRTYGNRIHHVDLYRLEGTQTEDLGLEELWDGGDIVIIEWAEKIQKSLPQRRVDIHFTYVDEHTRRITVTEKD
ncbi:MAG TPA: tRNA (adenosine(37)-N6)-threonylcarbamoyltransferase complex ATPase subunit type 1 TsaE [Patescibacteria group bacterium]|nr:tRNA (adenosine(37)-N6)-threonylcarbamoyltransferase complex ATPase subunit type 1 TsaE [Patescibacteria group bacterium]